MVNFIAEKNQVAFCYFPPSFFPSYFSFIQLYFLFFLYFTILAALFQPGALGLISHLTRICIYIYIHR